MKFILNYIFIFRTARLFFISILRKQYIYFVWPYDMINSCVCFSIIAKSGSLTVNGKNHQQRVAVASASGKNSNHNFRY